MFCISRRSSQNRKFHNTNQCIEKALKSAISPLLQTPKTSLPPPNYRKLKKSQSLTSRQITFHVENLYLFTEFNSARSESENIPKDFLLYPLQPHSYWPFLVSQFLNLNPGMATIAKYFTTEAWKIYDFVYIYNALR